MEEDDFIYSIDNSNLHEILCYHDVFDGEIPNIEKEIVELNMHKTISIVCELIMARQYKISVKNLPFQIDLPFEMALKKMVGIDASSSKEMFSNKLLEKNKHIIALQPLLILLKKVMLYGNYNTLKETNYVIEENDYINILKLHLIVSEEMNTRFAEKEVDIDHFIYGNYHINYDRNVSNSFLRSYYMLEKLSRDKDNFDDDVQNEFKAYFDDFTSKYGYSPTQYLSLLFWELHPYFSSNNALAYQSIWKNAETVYGKTAMKSIGKSVIDDLSFIPADNVNWADETNDRLWDFSKFYEYPFIVDCQENYISISELTLKNCFFEKLFWKIRECYPQQDSRAMAFYGRLFEKYVQDMTKSAIDNTQNLTYVSEFEFDGNKKSSDAYIVKSNNMIIVEVKGYSILLDSLTQNECIDKNNSKLFIEPVLQADKSFHQIDVQGSCFEDVENIYIISVTMDNVSAVPKYLSDSIQEIFSKKVSPKTKYVFNLCIEEYEMLMFLAETNCDIFSILESYFKCEKILPFSSYLHIHIKRDFEMTKFMQEIYSEATDVMQNMYKVKP